MMVKLVWNLLHTVSNQRGPAPWSSSRAPTPYLSTCWGGISWIILEAVLLGNTFSLLRLLPRSTYRRAELNPSQTSLLSAASSVAPLACLFNKSPSSQQPSICLLKESFQKTNHQNCTHAPDKVSPVFPIQP